MRNLRDAAEQAVKGAAKSDHAPGFLAIGAHSGHHIVAFAPEPQKFREQRGRIFEVAVNLDCRGAVGMAVACENGTVEPEITGETEHVNIGITCGELLQFAKGSV